MRSFYALILAGLGLATPVLAMPVPDCAGGVEVSHAKIIRVEKNGALILEDGRAVMLEGIRLPLDGRGPPSLADDTLSALRSLALATPLTLTAVPPKEDRYDRVRVQAFGDRWIQTELLKRGLARVELSPDRGECAADLYAAEKQARSSGAGLWAFPALTIRKPATVTTADEGSYQVVEGKVTDTADHDGHLVLNFSPDYRGGFSAAIASEDRKAFRGARPSLDDIAGHTVRVRGVVTVNAGHPQILLASPAQIELLQ